jgi:hypothetical protein
MPQIMKTRISCFRLVQSRLNAFCSSPHESQSNKVRLFSILSMLSSSFQSVFVDTYNPNGEIISKSHLFLESFLETNMNQLLQLFEKFHEIQTATTQFTHLFIKIVNCCPVETYNYSESLIETIFVAMKKNPYKYCEVG